MLFGKGGIVFQRIHAEHEVGYVKTLDFFGTVTQRPGIAWFSRR